jgi:hypothetical protein
VSDRFDLVAVVADQVRQWVPYLCHYLLACLLVFVASTDALYMVKTARDGVITLNWPLKVCPQTLNPAPCTLNPEPCTLNHAPCNPR